jgi:hypothetical protein
MVHYGPAANSKMAPSNPGLHDTQGMLLETFNLMRAGNGASRCGDLSLSTEHAEADPPRREVGRGDPESHAGYGDAHHVPCFVEANDGPNGIGNLLARGLSPGFGGRE